MNAQAIKLLNILAASQPEEDELVKEAKVQSIVNSKQYKKIQARQAFSQEFNRIFALDKLRMYSLVELNKVQDVLPILPTCLENILYSLKNGRCSELTAADRPDFLDKNAVEGLAKRLENSSGRNYCNIPAENFLAIFDDKTIKNPKDFFGKLPASTEDYEKAIAEVLSPQLYCISSEQLKLQQEDYESQIAAMEGTIQKGKTKRYFYRALKLIVGFSAISLPAYISSLTGNLTSGVTTGCTLLMTVVAIIYWIKG